MLYYSFSSSCLLQQSYSFSNKWILDWGAEELFHFHLLFQSIQNLFFPPKFRILLWRTCRVSCSCSVLSLITSLNMCSLIQIPFLWHYALVYCVGTGFNVKREKNLKSYVLYEKCDWIVKELQSTHTATRQAFPSDSGTVENNH